MVKNRQLKKTKEDNIHQEVKKVWGVGQIRNVLILEFLVSGLYLQERTAGTTSVGFHARERNMNAVGPSLDPEPKTPIPKTPVPES